MAIVFGVIAWLQFSADDTDEPADTNENDTLPSEPVVNDTDSAGDLNDTDGNNTQNNDTITTNNSIPNPAGKITGNDIRDASGGYFCNKIIDPTHGLRLYTYKIIGGVKNLSEEYLEADKLNVCDYYNNETVTAGVTYNMNWEWTCVDEIDGYRAYQYYKWGNITRDYDYYVELSKTATRLYDTGLDLWKEA